MKSASLWLKNNVDLNDHAVEATVPGLHLTWHSDIELVSIYRLRYIGHILNFAAQAFLQVDSRNIDDVPKDPADFTAFLEQ